MDLRDHMPAGFAEAYPAESLIQWSKDGLRVSRSFQDPSRADYLQALDLAAVESADRNYEPLYALRREGEESIVRAFQQPPDPGKLMIYRVYNEGVILRTTDTCIAIDVILDPGHPTLAAQYASVLDALLVTHDDLDHFDINGLAAEMKKLGKPVIRQKDDPSKFLGAPISSGTIGAADWIAFRGGHYDLRFSSFYLVTIANWRILHSGDNTTWRHFEDSEYAKGLDIFMLAPTIIEEELPELVQRLHPRLIIPHHILELGHGIEEYDYGHEWAIRLGRQVPIGTEVILMEWGSIATYSSPSGGAELIARDD
jgi:L-ascorbate metabolism protein UlaG (beta-lactamase superfamily)